MTSNNSALDERIKKLENTVQQMVGQMNSTPRRSLPAQVSKSVTALDDCRAEMKNLDEFMTFERTMVGETDKLKEMVSFFCYCAYMLQKLVNNVHILSFMSVNVMSCDKYVHNTGLWSFIVYVMSV